MRKFVKSKLKEEKGLTLIELLAVIVILGIIAAIAIPAIGNVIENSRYGAAKSDMLNAISAANVYAADKGEDPSNLTDLSDFLENKGTITDATFSRTGDNMAITADLTVSGNSHGDVGPYTVDELNGFSNSEFKKALQGE